MVRGKGEGNQYICFLFWDGRLFLNFPKTKPEIISHYGDNPRFDMLNLTYAQTETSN